MDTQKLIKKLRTLVNNPDLGILFSQEETAYLMTVLLNRLDETYQLIEQGKIKGEDGVTPVAGQDYLTPAQQKEIVTALFADAAQKHNKALETAVAGLQNGKDGADGKDAEITPEQIAEAAEKAYQMIELPDFDTLITESPEAVRNALELLQGDERYKVQIEDVERLQERLEALERRPQSSGDSRGGTSKPAVVRFVNEAIAAGEITVGSAVTFQEEDGSPTGTFDTIKVTNGTLTDNGDGSASINIPPPGGGEANTASNVGTAGVGVFKQKTSANLEFKNINAGSSSVTVTDDTGNDEIDIDLSAGTKASLALADSAQQPPAEGAFVDGDKTKLDGIEANATADQSAAEIKTAYESNADTNAFTDAEKTKLGTVETNADVTDETNVRAAGAPIVSSGAGAPSSTPTAVGDIYIDTTNDDAYIATGTASSADWEISNDGTGGGISDGDKGDITVSGSGATWTIDDEAVTLAKMAHVATNRFLGRSTAGTGDVESLTVTQARTLLNVEDGADVTDTANVTAAGALMDSEVDADIKTLALPANTTISTFGASLVDDADAAAARTTLGVDIGTDVQAWSAALDVVTGTNTGDEVIQSGAGVPATTPSFVGQRYIDTTNDLVYIATDTVSSADWDVVATATAGTPSKGSILVGDGVDSFDEVVAGTDNQILVYDSAQSLGIKKVDLNSGINFVIDGGGSAITTGVKGYVEIPFDCTITAVTMLADQSGSIVVDVWKDTYANYPPTDADSITASAVPTISTATKSQDTTLTGWTTACAAGDILGFNVDSASTVTRVTIALKVTRTF